MAQGLPCGPTLWLKRLPSGPATPEPEGRGWLVNFATVSKAHSSKPEGPLQRSRGVRRYRRLWRLAPENAGRVGVRKIEAIQDVISG